MAALIFLFYIFRPAKIDWKLPAFDSLRTQTALREVVTFRYQHHHHVNNEVPQLHAMLSEPLN